MKPITKSITLDNGLTVQLETGMLARQAHGAVVLRVDNLMLLATVCAAEEFDPNASFLPLSVDYREKFAANGRIPGGFLKREARPNDHEVLTSRVIDRSLRPLFPDGYKPEIQVIVQLFSADERHQADAYACVAASAAILVSDIPFPEPVATVRVAYIDGQYVINPSAEATANAEMDLIVAGTPENLAMVEGEAREVSENVMVGSLSVAHNAIKQLTQLQLDLRAEVNPGVRDYPKPEPHDALRQRVDQLVRKSLEDWAHNHTAAKKERNLAVKQAKQTMLDTLAAEMPEFVEQKLDVLAKGFFKDVQSEVLRRMILEEGLRLDGRGTEDIRPIFCQTDYLPRAHGSALFVRGETQSITTVTLGSKLDEQIVDQATVQGYRKFMLQYNFPPFSTGEVKRFGAPGRREVGHGNLAERAVKNQLPDDLPYTLRVVSDILESNGSSSMATVCAASMALMDTGIALKQPVSGIAMGLVWQDGKYAILTDILGDEDHLGDMDFKVCGTANGITACQMDMKVRGMSYEVMAEALEQARRARLHILEKMNAAISTARPDLKPFAPRMERIEIPEKYIGAVIGPGGKVVQELQKSTGTIITIEDAGNKGIVTISSPDKASIEAARNRVLNIVMEPEEGKIYLGKVVNITESAAYVEFMPNRDGYLHISEIAWERIPTIEDVLKKGDVVEVQYVGIDPRNGKFRLSRKVLLPKPEGYVEPERRSGPPPHRNGRGGDRRGGGRR